MMNWRKILQEKTNLQIPDSKDEFNIRCPFHDDKVPSLSINTKHGLWICHSGCGQGTLREFLVKYLGTRMFTLPHEEDYDFIFSLEDIEEEEIGELSEVVCPFDFSDFPAWIMDRGFNRPTIKKWGFGRNKATGSLVIPIKDNNARLVGWVCRAPPKSEHRYTYSKGLRTSQLLFGEHFLKNASGWIDPIKGPYSYICIVEGPLDAIWLDQNKIPAVALLGINMSRSQERRLENLRAGEFVLCLDNDIAGQTAIKTIGRRLAKYGVVSYIQLPESAKDVQDVRKKDQIVSIINNRTCFQGI